jgi:hypothetical protein
MWSVNKPEQLQAPIHAVEGPLVVERTGGNEVVYCPFELGILGFRLK